MIHCKECNATQYEGALFCNECGSFLTQEQRETTDVLPFANFQTHLPPALPNDFRPETLTNPKNITFVIPQQRKRHVVALTSQIRIGRKGQEFDERPELDLSENEAAELGVSRMHAIIQWSNYGLVVLDLGSTNGTLLNNSRLPAQRPFPLQSGDELRLSELLVHVFFD
jgi:hypothetical protein